jgi:hypothetical protein
VLTDVAQVVRDTLIDLGVEWEEPATGSFVAVLPGDRKLRTTVSIAVGPHRLTVNAFVVRHPDENEEQFWRWLLRHNARHPGLAFGVDPLGDVYLVGAMPREAVTASAIDQVLGQVLAVADGAFNTLLELGFAESIRREWRWRHSRGEPTDNLEAFTHLDPAGGDGP